MATAQGDSTALDTAYNDAITGINEQLTIGDAPESMQERTVIEDKFGDLMLNPDLQDAQNVITGSGVNLSGNCSFTYDYKGTSDNLFSL
jgi:midasin (ATPase involved in ribosome maturation)